MKKATKFSKFVAAALSLLLVSSLCASSACAQDGGISALVSEQQNSKTNQTGTGDASDETTNDTTNKADANANEAVPASDKLNAPSNDSNICKIVDTNGKVHLFQSLQAANDWLSTDDGEDGWIDIGNNDYTATIEMLVDYDVPEQVVFTATYAKRDETGGDLVEDHPAKLVLTTASKTATDGYPFQGAGDVAVLKRGFTGDSIFLVGGSDRATQAVNMYFKNITMDGDSSYSFDAANNVGGACMRISKGSSCAITTGATITGFVSEGLGTVFVGSGRTDFDFYDDDDNFISTTFDINEDAKITKCTAASGGAVYLGAGANFAMRPDNLNTNEKGGAIEDCKATTGGGGAIAAVSSNSFDILNATITGCSAPRGSAIWLDTTDVPTNDNAMSTLIFINGSTKITQNICTTSDDDASAVSVPKFSDTNLQATVTFGGSIQITDNTDAAGTEKDVLEASDYNKGNIVKFEGSRITGESIDLAADAVVGIYSLHNYKAGNKFAETYDRSDAANYNYYTGVKNNRNSTIPAVAKGDGSNSVLWTPGPTVEDTHTQKVVQNADGTYSKVKGSTFVVYEYTGTTEITADNVNSGDVTGSVSTDGKSMEGNMWQPVNDYETATYDADSSTTGAVSYCSDATGYIRRGNDASVNLALKSGTQYAILETSVSGGVHKYDGALIVEYGYDTNGNLILQSNFQKEDQSGNKPLTMQTSITTGKDSSGQAITETGIFIVNELPKASQINVTKVGANLNTGLYTAATGAKFNIYEYVGSTELTAANVDNYSDLTNESNWLPVTKPYEVESEAGGTPYEYYSNSDGLLDYDHSAYQVQTPSGALLKENVQYAIVETQAPDNFQKAQGAWVVKFSYNDEGVFALASSFCQKGTDGQKPPAILTTIDTGTGSTQDGCFLVNYPVYNLPFTGKSASPLIVAGICAVAMGIVFALKRRKGKMRP